MPGFDIHLEPYKHGGSMHGWCDANFSPGFSELVDYSGAMSWSKLAVPEISQERNYKNGFFVQEMAVTGSQYFPPVSGSDELILSLEQGENNAVFGVYDFNEVYQGVWKAFTVTNQNKAILPEPTPALQVRSLLINIAQGTYSGILTLTDPNPSDPAHPWKRTAPFQGVILNTMLVAQGFCLIPELPDEAGETLMNTPLRSCTVQIVHPWE